MTKRIVLAYSGGLDTSVAIGWIAEQTGAEVIAVAVDVGQGGEDLATIRQRALDCGATESEVADARDEFAAGYCLPALRANALYMHRYPLVSALSRPLIVSHLAAVAREYGATMVSHGCTGKGNDQVRFEAGMAALAPGGQGARPGPRLRHDQGQGDRVRRGEGPADRRDRQVAVLDRPEPVGPQLRDRAPGGHLGGARTTTSGATPSDPAQPRARGRGRRSASPTALPVAIDGRPLSPLERSPS